MEIRNLSTFMKVAEEQSLSKAAKQLGYAQSTVTMQMQQLEQELGISLYERVGKQIRITQEGQVLLTYAAQILKTSQEALQIGKGSAQKVDGSLRLGLSNTLGDCWQGRVLCKFATKYPQVQLVVQGGSGKELLHMLLHNQIDLMMTIDHPITDSALIRGQERQEGVHFVTTPSHPLGSSFHKSSLSLADILKYPILRGDLENTYEQDLDMAMLDEGMEPQAYSVIKNHQVLLHLLLHQGGMALLPDHMTQQHLEEGKLVRLNYELPRTQLWQQTLYHKNKWVTGAMNAWIKLLEELP